MHAVGLKPRKVSAALTPDQNDRVREGMQQLLDEAGGNCAAVGRRIGKDPTWIIKLMQGVAGASLETASIVAREVGKSVGELLGLTEHTLARWSQIPGYEEALATAQEVSGNRYAPRVWEIVGRLHIEPAPDHLDAKMLLDAAQLVDGLRAKKASGSDTNPPSTRGKSHSKIRKPRA